MILVGWGWPCASAPGRATLESVRIVGTGLRVGHSAVDALDGAGPVSLAAAGAIVPKGR
jgi:hypothetical protein